MDRNAIMREIRQLKAKLNFDPSQHKLDNLSVLTVEGEDWRKIAGLYKYRPRKNKNAKMTPQVSHVSQNSQKSGSSPSASSRKECMILAASQKSMHDTNRQKQEEDKRQDAVSSQYHGKENSSSELPNPQQPNYDIPESKNALQEQKVDKFATPKVIEFKQSDFGSGATAACSTDAFKNSQMKSIQKSDSHNYGTRSSTPKKCFKNLSEKIFTVSSKTGSPKESVSKFTIPSIRSKLEGIDFDTLTPVICSKKLDFEFENVLELNSCVSTLNDQTQEYYGDNFSFFGDAEFSLAHMY
jgi:hypothetical protein